MAKTRPGKPATVSLPEASKERHWNPTYILSQNQVAAAASSARVVIASSPGRKINYQSRKSANAGYRKCWFGKDHLRCRLSYGHTSANSSGISSIIQTPILSVFLGYLTFGIQQVVPGFGKAMFAYLQEASAELAQNPERAVDVLDQ